MNTMLTIRKLLVITALSLPITGCFVDLTSSPDSEGGTGGGNAPQAEPETMQFLMHCTKTECETDLDHCAKDCSNSSAPSVCRKDCAETYSVGKPACSSECDEGTFSVVAPKRDPNVQAACERAVARDVACGSKQVDEHCARRSRVERPEAAAVYDCIAQLPCGADADNCLAPLSLPREPLGTAFCAVADIMLVAPNECKSEFKQELNADTNWLRQDVVDVAYACMHIGGHFNWFWDCSSLWVTAVYGDDYKYGLYYEKPYYY